MSDASAWPLAGMRVIDLSTEIAGPYCTKLFVDAGADVIKLEPPGGDPLRRWTASGTPLAADEDGALFQYLNASKRSVHTDLSTAHGCDLLLQFAATADLVVESLAPGTLARHGLTLQALHRRNAALSVVSITPWGTTGPWARRPATEFTVQAATGATAHRGLRDRVPVAAGGRIGEWIVGTYAAVGALFAWLSARITGRGHHVDVSMFEAQLLSMTTYHDLQSQWREGPLPRAIEVPSIEPAKDGWVGFCTITGQQWTDFCTMIGHPEVAEDAQYFDAYRRVEHLPFMQQIIHGWTRQRTVDEIIEVATAMRIPVTPVGNGRTTPAVDQLVACNIFRKGPGNFLCPRPPYRLQRTVLRPFGAAPKLGEHTAQVLQELERVHPRVVTNAHSAHASFPSAAALPLAGLRIVDLTVFWAGPVATSVLGDLGADVIKIESIQRPDGMRFAGAARKDPLWEWSPVYAGNNTSKRAITLNLNSADGITLLRRLIATADVVAENFSPRVLEQFGIGWDVIQALNPRAILLRMPAFGLDGPWRDRTGFAMTIEQTSGLAWMTGYPDMPLVVRGACDPLGGMHAVWALLLALEHRRRTGEAQLVEVPLLEPALNIAAEQVIEYSAYGTLLQRAGNRGPYAAPQGVYRCAGADDYVAVAVTNDAQWEALRALLGNPGWACDPALVTAAGRRAAHDELDRHLGHWTSGLAAEQAAERLVAAGIPAQRLINAHTLTPNPQLEHRGFFQVMRHTVTGPTRYPGLPMAFSGLPRQLHTSPPPTLGQHNDEILRGELGLSDHELARLRESKVIGERPAFTVG